MLPSLFQRFDRRYPYQGIHILGPDAEVYYAARVREVYDGFPTLGNTFFSAPKDQPAMQPPLPEQTIAFAGKLAGMDALGAFLASKAVLAVAVFLAFAWLLFVITGRPWVSLLAAVAALQAGALLAAPWDAPLFLRPQSASFEFLRFSRAVNPQWTVTFFLIELALAGWWIRRNKRLPILLAAVFSFTLVYSYVYAWTYFFTVMGLLTLWYLFKRDMRRIADLVFFWAIVGVVSTPYLMHLWVLTHHPWYAESSRRLGLVLRYGPPVLGVWSAVFIGFAAASRRVWPKTWPLLPAVALAGLIAFNQHLVTGHFIVPHHYNWYFIQPLASIIACAYVLSIIPQTWMRPKTAVLLGVFAVTSATMVAAVQQRVAYRGVADFWGRMQAAAPVIRYASKTLRAGQVVYSQDVNILNQIPIYGSADVYHAGNANLALSPDERSRFVYFFDLWLQGVTPDQAARDFRSIRRWMLSSRMHAIYYREAAGDYANIPDDEVDAAVVAYREFYRLPLKDKLTRYPLTAVITTPGDPANPAWSQFLGCSREVFAENGYAIRMMIAPGYPKSCL